MFTAVSGQKSTGLTRCGRFLLPTSGEEMESHFLLPLYTKVICSLLPFSGQIVNYILIKSKLMFRIRSKISFYIFDN